MSTTDAARPTAEVVPEIEGMEICDRVEELMRQLAEALAEWHETAGKAHTFVAHVPSSQSGRPYFLKAEEWRGDNAEMRLTHHAKEFATAAKEIDPSATEFWLGRAVNDLPGGPRFTVVVASPERAA